jgi:hypothetical protein
MVIFFFFNEVMYWKLIICIVQVVKQLEPNDRKICPADDNLGKVIGDQYKEGMRHGNFKNEEWHENVINF